MPTNKASSKSDSKTTRYNSAEKTLIVLCAPSPKNDYYSTKFIDTIDYIINFANLVHGKDEVVILADADTLPLLQGKVPSNILLEADIGDIWIRDFSPVIPSKQVKFKYLPEYLFISEAKEFENSFEDWFFKNGLKYHAKSDIILDGGNLVENTTGTRIVVTDRILQDNPQLTKSDAKTKLKELLGAKQIAIIPEPPNDITGHADGVVMWATDNKILLIKGPEPMHTKVVNELKSSFPGVQIVEVANHIPNTTWDGFPSAFNCFVNSIVTNNYIYMPTFNDGHDAEMLQLFKLHTNKKIVPIPAENVAEMGGSVRCLSWQVKNGNRRKILQLLKQ